MCIHAPAASPRLKLDEEGVVRRCNASLGLERMPLAAGVVREHAVADLHRVGASPGGGKRRGALTLSVDLLDELLLAQIDTVGDDDGEKLVKLPWRWQGRVREGGWWR